MYILVSSCYVAYYVTVSVVDLYEKKSQVFHTSYLPKLQSGKDAIPTSNLAQDKATK